MPGAPRPAPRRARARAWPTARRSHPRRRPRTSAAQAPPSPPSPEETRLLNSDWRSPARPPKRSTRTRPRAKWPERPSTEPSPPAAPLGPGLASDPPCASPPEPLGMDHAPDITANRVLPTPRTSDRVLPLLGTSSPSLASRVVSRQTDVGHPGMPHPRRCPGSHEAAPKVALAAPLVGLVVAPVVACEAAPHRLQRAREERLSRRRLCRVRHRPRVLRGMPRSPIYAGCVRVCGRLRTSSRSQGSALLRTQTMTCYPCRAASQAHRDALSNIRRL